MNKNFSINIILLLFLCLLLLFSCSRGKKKKQVEIPANIIPQDSMVLILTEVHLIESAIFMQQQQGMNQDKRLVKQYYQHFFNQKQLSFNRLKNSIMFYSFHPDEYEKIYIEIVNQLSIMESKTANDTIL